MDKTTIRCRIGAACFGTLLIVGCASTAARPSTLERRQPRLTSEPTRFGARSDVLTRTEIVQSGATSTAEVVRRLRPEFLRPTLLPAASGVVSVVASVFVNGAHEGGPEALQTIALDVVEEIRFISTAQARDAWGPGCQCNGGVIHVRTKR